MLGRKEKKVKSKNIREWSSVQVGSAAVFEAAVLVCQDFPIAHSAWQRIMASLHSALRISPCKSSASGGMRAGKQPGASRPLWSKHSGLALITNARRRLRNRVNRFCT